MQATPPTWRSLVAQCGDRPPDLRAVLCGGEALAVDLGQALTRMGQAAWNLYGPTETTIWSTAARLDGDSASVPIGLPLAGERVHVLDERLEPTPLGVPGELYIAGTGLARGYHNHPALTAQRFLPDPHGPPGTRLYRTGDRGRRRPDGTLEHLGRTDRQLKLRGHRIEPAEIEHALTRHPHIQHAIVTTHQPTPTDQRLVAYITTPPGHPPPTTAQIHTHLGQLLPAHMVPNLIVPIDHIPTTANGKTDYHALPPPTHQRTADQQAGQAPRTSTEQAVAAAWQSLLGLARVGVEDDFFLLGGHSLLATQVIGELERSLGRGIPVRLLLAHPTLAEFAAAVDGLGAPPATDEPAHRRPPAPEPGRQTLLTGGTGMAGNFIAGELSRRGHRTRLLARPASARMAADLGDEVRLGDLNDAGSVAGAADGTAGIVHAACTFDDPEVDVASMRALVRAWGDGPFVYLSSVDVYGRPADGEPVTEDRPLAPATPYARGKARCEELLTLAATRQGRADFTILRLPYIWGPHPYCWWQLRATWAGPLLAALESGGPVELPDVPAAEWATFGHAWVDARDLAWVVAEALQRPAGGPVNLIGGHFTWAALFSAFAELNGGELRLRHRGPREDLYAAARRYDGRRAGRHFGFTPTRTWQQTLGELVALVRAAPAG
jgi:nucleoside-diphosphate-sugar epimerase